VPPHQEPSVHCRSGGSNLSCLPLCTGFAGGSFAPLSGLSTRTVPPRPSFQGPAPLPGRAHQREKRKARCRFSSSGLGRASPCLAGSAGPMSRAERGDPSASSGHRGVCAPTKASVRQTQRSLDCARDDGRGRCTAGEREVNISAMMRHATNRGRRTRTHGS
jgi:hypothetical protein